MAFAVGRISGCHLNPAVSVGLWAGGRFPAKDPVPYIVAWVIGAVFDAAELLLIAPLIGALLAGGVYRFLGAEDRT